MKCEAGDAKRDERWDLAAAKPAKSRCRPKSLAAQRAAGECLVGGRERSFIGRESAGARACNGGREREGWVVRRPGLLRYNA
jgi:hypothetical protein